METIMTSEAIGKILSDIGALVGSEAGVGTGDAFLYAEAAENVVGASLFKEKDDRVTYIPTRVRTHKPDSLGGANVIQALRQQERGFERVLVE